MGDQCLLKAGLGIWLFIRDIWINRCSCLHADTAEDPKLHLRSIPNNKLIKGKLASSPLTQLLVYEKYKRQLVTSWGHYKKNSDYKKLYWIKMKEKRRRGKREGEGDMEGG